MSKEEVGTYDYLYSFAFAMAPALNLGLYVSLTKMYHLYDNPKDKGKRREFFFYDAKEGEAFRVDD